MNLQIQILIILITFVLNNNIAAQTLVSVNPPSTVLSSGSTVTLSVNISNVTRLRSYSVKINFNNNVLGYINSYKSGFLSMNGMNSTIFLTQPTQPNVINHVTVSEAILGSVPTPVGSGTLFTISFSTLNAGTTPIEIESVVLYDSLNQLIDADFSSGQVTLRLSVQAKAFLCGPYSNGQMSTSLNSQMILPFAHPYGISPFNYTGTESVNPIFYINHPEIVDWVLIELRTGLGENTKVGEKAGFIKSDGVIVGVDGISPVNFDLPSADYYIIIKHRNHLQILSASAIPLSYNFSVYDFTTSKLSAFGSDPMKQLDKNTFALYAGDVDANKQITAMDRILVWNSTNLIGYLFSDVSMDGLVNAIDRIFVWNNKNKTAQP